MTLENEYFEVEFHVRYSNRRPHTVSEHNWTMQPIYFCLLFKGRVITLTLNCPILGCQTLFK